MGHWPPFDVTTSDGRRVRVRVAEPDDARGLLGVFESLAVDGEGSLTTPEELNFGVGDQARWIREHREKEDWLALVPVDVEAGEVVGVCHFENEKLARLAHGGALGVGLVPGWRGVSLGRALLAALLDWARENPRIERVELACLATNERALALYRSLGFVEEGRKARLCKLEDGTYVDDVLMALRTG